MSRWRKVDVRLWGDERVRKLSRPAPSGLVCWLYLLTARESTAFPGVISAGAAALAESLGWSKSAFLKQFTQLAALEMADADWGAGLVWLPKALKYNPPQSLNAVKAWAKSWDELPDCELKQRIRSQAEAFLEVMGEGFRHAFRQASVKASPPEQEKEQKNKQEEMSGQKSSSAPIHEQFPDEAATPGKSASTRKLSEQQEFAAWFEAQRKEALAEDWVEDRRLGVARLNKVLGWVIGEDADLVAAAAALYLEDPRRRAQDPPCCLLWFAQDRADYLSRARRGAA